MKEAIFTIASCLMSGCASVEQYHDVLVRLDHVERCELPGALGREGYCRISGTTADGAVIKGDIFTLGEPGDTVLLKCGESWRCLPQARAIQNDGV